MDWLPLLDLTELTALLIALCPTLPDLGADFTFRPLLDRFASVLAADVLAFGVDLGFRSVFAALLAAALPGLFERAIGYLLILRVRLSLAMAFLHLSKDICYRQLHKTCYRLPATALARRPVGRLTSNSNPVSGD